MPAEPRGARKRIAVVAKPTLSLTHSTLEHLLVEAHDGGNPEEIAAREFSNDRPGVAAAVGYTFQTALRPLPLESPLEDVDTKEFVTGTVMALINRLHEEQPKHPMFGEQEEYVFR